MFSCLRYSLHSQFSITLAGITTYALGLSLPYSASPHHPRCCQGLETKKWLCLKKHAPWGEGGKLVEILPPISMPWNTSMQVHFVKIKSTTTHYTRYCSPHSDMLLCSTAVFGRTPSWEKNFAYVVNSHNTWKVKALEQSLFPTSHNSLLYVTGLNFIHWLALYTRCLEDYFEVDKTCEWH